VVEEVKSILEQNNKKGTFQEIENSGFFMTASRIKSYEDLKRSYSLFIFVTTFMGILFFIAAGSMLYFKQYTEMSTSQAKFLKLYKLGITTMEVKSIISKELKITFFTPLIFGSLLGYSFIYFMTCWVGGEGVLRDFMINATIVVAAYFVFQWFFYLVTKRKYTLEILSNM
jgi:putative ABC transport system permease protein